MRLGFSIVPHTWVPEKIARDCYSCPLFRNCGQYAVVLDLHHARTLVGTSVGTPVENLRGNLRGNPRQFPCLTFARSPVA